MAELRRVSFRDGRLASRKAEEAALRRHQAAAWLQAMIGSFGLAPYPSEQEFVASLRNGIVLCKAINKLQPGAVAKIITNAPRDSQPSTAFQYFENIRNFLVAVNKLKLPNFEASDLDKDNLDAGTVGKIVDCVISLKSYHEWKQAGGANGPIKYMKSPLAMRSSKIQSENVALGPSLSQKRLDLTQPFQNEDPNIKEAMEKLQKIIVDSMLSYKENFDQDILKKDPTKLIGAVLANQLGKEQLLSPEMVMAENEPTHCIEHSNSQNENKQLLLQADETELLYLKKMFQDVKVNFTSLQTQFLDDMTKLGENIQDLFKAAIGYNQAVKENRNLYNMLQELETAHANKESFEIRELKEQVDTLKKALASKDPEKSSLKLKENAITCERTKQVLDRTPPRRLSLENASSYKARMPERKTLKSPHSAMGITRGKECNNDGFRHTNHQKSAIQMPAACVEDLVREEKIICTIDTVEFRQLPPEAYNLLKQSGLNTPEAALCRSRNLCTEASCGDAPSTARLEKIMTGTAVKKGSHSHLRKSIQSGIGRLIHGTERRNAQAQHSAQRTPTKITANTCHNISSPITADIRLRRRQSLTGIPPPPSTISRRSSLGGKSDKSSNDKRDPKTPPPVNSAAKAKRWL